jgi:hypothetical protein
MHKGDRQVSAGLEDFLTESFDVTTLRGFRGYAATECDVV